MRITADMTFITAVFLAFTRLSSLFLMTPLFSVAQVPFRIRLVFLLALSLTLVVGLRLGVPEVPASLFELLAAMIHEVLVGAALAFGIFAAFAAFLFGGRMLDLQMGFGVANLIDPSTNAQAPLIGTILNLTAVMVFFLLDGHHMIIRGLAYSLEQVPLGQGLEALNLQAIVFQFGQMFVFGLMLVAPAVFCLFLVDVGLAVAARTMPQVNIFIVGLPLKIFVGLVMLAASLNYLNPLINRIFLSIFQYWEAVLR